MLIRQDDPDEAGGEGSPGPGCKREACASAGSRGKEGLQASSNPLGWWASPVL